MFKKAEKWNNVMTLDRGVSMITSKWKDMECHGMMMSSHGKGKRSKETKRKMNRGES